MSLPSSTPRPIRASLVGAAALAVSLGSSLSRVEAQVVFEETFDDPGATTPAGPANLVAAGWEFRVQLGASPSALWRTGTNQDWIPYSWPTFLLIEGLPVAGQPAAAWAILPPIGGTALGQQVFFAFHPWVDPLFFGTVDEWELYWSPTGGTDTGSAWDDLGDFTVPVDLNVVNPGSNSGWLTGSGSLPGAGGRLALRYVFDTWYGGSTPRAAVDDVTIVDDQAAPLPDPGETVRWTAAMSPIAVLDEKLVPPGATLIVDAGVEVRFSTSSGKLRVQGDLRLEGSAGAPVLLRLMPGDDPLVERIYVGYTDYNSTAKLAPARAELSHVDADVLVRTADGASLSLRSATFHQPSGLPWRYAGVDASESTVAIRDSSFTNGLVFLSESYLYIDQTTFQDALLGSQRYLAGSPIHIDNVTVQDYEPGQTFLGAAPISLFGSDHWLGSGNVIAGNPLPVTLRGGGLARGSVVPSTGNDQNVVEFIDGEAHGVMTLADVGVPYVWRYDSSFRRLVGIVDVEPGVTIQFEAGAGVYPCAGSRFNALGEPGAPITLTALTSGLRWDGINYCVNSRPKLEHCIVEGADYAVNANNTVARFESCIFRDNNVAANAVQSGRIEAGKTCFLDNGTGVRITPTSGARLDGDANPNRLEGNAVAIQDLGAQFAPLARDNYWGDPTGPQHPSNPGGAGDPVLGANVQVLPFRATPPDATDHPPLVRFEPIMSYMAPGVKLILHWTAEDDGSIVEHRLEYTPHGENPPLSLFAAGIPGDARSFEVTIPQPVPSSNINPPAFRIVAIDDAGQEGWSDVLFYHAEPGDLPFQVTTDLSAGLNVGQQFALEWTGSVSGNVTLSFEDMLTFVDLGSTVSSIPIVLNKVPSVSTDLARYLWSNAGGYYYSDYFEVRPESLVDDEPPTVTMNAPRHGQRFRGGGLVPVEWTASDDEGLRSFDLQASYDGGNTWHPIVRDLDGATRQYAWRLPESRGIPDVRVRVIARDERFQASSDGTDSVISIVPGPWATRFRAAPPSVER